MGRRFRLMTTYRNNARRTFIVDRHNAFGIALQQSSIYT